MTVGSMPLLGILLALASAAALSLGNIWQSRGVNIVAERASGAGSFMQLLKTPIWLGGAGLLGVAIVLQMASLAFAPLVLVQPIGVVALVFTALFTARATGKRPSRAVVTAISISLLGVTAYVIIAAMVSKQHPIGDDQLIEMLLILLGVLVASAVVLWIGKSGKQAPVLYVILGGVYSGFVATLGKTVILRVEQMFKGGHLTFGTEGWLTVLCLLGIGVASALSIYFVQYSHTCNSPEVVIAGLTVVDPAIAVVLGITVLQETAGAPIWSTFGFIVAGAVAFTGVLKLAKADTDDTGTDEATTQEAGS